ncbi:glycine cleavage system aminomethyltransferase GcvT [Bacillus carboniphilus]|uniref:Aminomethyltransferase n=1 Tax=Bacillus carboniphilus TaxID=86663 RepID=A0ABN0WU49_9BACI
MSALKRTPLFESYGGAKTIDFGGWDLPVQFSSIKEEHEAVRTKAGLFDVSHMGEITVKGPNSLAYLQKLLTNDVSKVKPGGAQYSAMCYEDGGTVDDLLVYMLDENDYLLVVNASNIEKDYEWMLTQKFGDVEIENVSETLAQLAIQGPKAEEILQTIVEGTNLADIRFFKFRENVQVAGVSSLVSRTGYTGEDGFEIYCHANDAASLWNAIIQAGEPFGLVPCGLGARDTLRFEANLPLYGQELSKTITPIEAGIGFAVKVQKEMDFNGKETLKKQKEEGPARKLVGIEMVDRGIPRTGYPVYAQDEQIGEVTTGTQLPTSKRNVGVALVNAEHSEVDQELFVEIRGKKVKAVVVPLPFYKRPKN